LAAQNASEASQLDVQPKNRDTYKQRVLSMVIIVLRHTQAN